MKFSKKTIELWDEFCIKTLNDSIVSNDDTKERLESLEDDKKAQDILSFIIDTNCPMWLILDSVENYYKLEFLGKNYSTKNYDDYLKSFNKARRIMIASGVDYDLMSPLRKPSDIIHEIYTEYTSNDTQKQFLKEIFSKGTIRKDDKLLAEQEKHKEEIDQLIKKDFLKITLEQALLIK